MATEVVDSAFSRSFGLYADLLSAVGFDADEEALARHLGCDEDERRAVEAAVAEGDPAAGEVPPGVAEAMEGLARDLKAKLVRDAQLSGSAEEVDDEVLLRMVESLDAEQKDRIADRLLSNGHAELVRPRYMEASRFRKIVGQDHDPEELALVKLVPYLRRQLDQRGFSFTNEEVRGFFEGGRQRRVPYCLKHIFQQVNGQFDKGLIPLEEMTGEEDPDEWLERVRKKLLFRSHSSMHKAVAEATSLKYDCVHKALSGRSKAKRIQAEIKYSLQRWMREVEAGREIDVDDDYRGVPVEWTCELLPRLQQRYDSKEELYRAISAQTGIKAGSVRRYFQSNGQLKYAPLQVYRLAKKLASGVEPPEQQSSYLEDEATRKAAHKLASKVEQARERWQASTDNPELEMEFRELRRALIVTIKEQHTAIPVVV